MKKFLTVVLAVIMSIACLALTACGGDENTLYVYTNAGFAPYEYVNTKGEVVGVDIDIMKEIGEVLGYKVVINDIEFNQILDEVQKNEFAIGAAGMTKTDERDAIALPSISYATSVQYVIVPTGTFDSDDLVDGKLNIAKLAELTNKAIGVQTGTTGDFMITDAIDGYADDDGNHVTGDLEGMGMSYLGYTNAIVASGDIGNQIGAVVIDKLPAESICDSNSGLECIELNAQPESYVLYLNKNATQLLAKINEVLEIMIENGVINFYTLKHSGGIV